MAWTEQWTIQVDGTHINRGPGSPSCVFQTVIPEIENQFEQDQILVPIDGDYPVFVRNQPREGSYTFIIHMTPCDWATWQTRLTTLKALFTPGVHTLTVQVRGMSATKSLSFIPVGLDASEAKARKVTVRAVAPKPVLT